MIYNWLLVKLWPQGLQALEAGSYLPTAERWLWSPLYRTGLMTWFWANSCIPLKGLSREPQLSRQASLTTNANPLLSVSHRACLTCLRLPRAAFLTPLHLWCTHSEAHPLSLASSALAPLPYDWTLCILQLRLASPELGIFSPVMFFFSNHLELSKVAATFSLLSSQG